jgi:hypothetical protein
MQNFSRKILQKKLLKKPIINVINILLLFNTLFLNINSLKSKQIICRLTNTTENKVNKK